MKISKAFRLLTILLCLTMLQACELFNKSGVSPAPIASSEPFTLCETPAQNETFAEFCSLDNWLAFVFEAAATEWPVRAEQIEQLNEDPRSLLQKVLLSQATDTPYRQRLRAQNWVLKVMAESSPSMQKVMEELVFQNSQQLLEFESAITILSRVNARQQKTISELQAQLEARQQEIQNQQEQVDQLLKIETDLIEQNRSEKR